MESAWCASIMSTPCHHGSNQWTIDIQNSRNFIFHRGFSRTRRTFFGRSVTIKLRGLIASYLSKSFSSPRIFRVLLMLVKQSCVNLGKLHFLDPATCLIDRKASQQKKDNRQTRFKTYIDSINHQLFPHLLSVSSHPPSLSSLSAWSKKEMMERTL